MKTIGELTKGDVSNFKRATFLNAPERAYKILSKLTHDIYFPTENTPTAWIDLVVKENKYYAAYAQAETSVWPKLCVYIEIEPSEFLKDEYRYYRQFKEEVAE